MLDEPTHTDDACEALLRHILEGERPLLGELAPDGLDNSALSSWVGHRSGSGRHRWLDLLGTVLWEVFSSNHDVRSADGVLYDLGSWRGSGGTIADFLNRHYEEELDGCFGYLDFYCGFVFHGREAGDEDDSDEALRPLFRYVFERLKAKQCTWLYAAAWMGAVSFAQPEETKDPAEYDPGAAALDEIERKEKDKSFEELRDKLDEANARARREAAEHPPMIVRAYREVYGAWPRYVGEGPEPGE